MKKIYFLVVALCFFRSVNAQFANIPDANFKARLLAASPTNQIAQDLSSNFFKIDANSDGEIQQSEALSVYYLDISDSNISDLAGISNFLNLNRLDCFHNQLTSLNLSGLVNLTYLNCRNNQLTSLNLAGLNNITAVYCSYNLLSSLEVSGLINLFNLICSNNQLISLSLNGLTNLQYLACDYNQLSDLNLNGTTSLGTLLCNNNQLSYLNMNDSPFLANIQCSYNLLTSLDFSGQIIYSMSLECISNANLNSINLKNGKFLASANYDFLTLNPNLRYICVDENELQQVQMYLVLNNRFDCQVNSYCSFAPGGVFYKIQGNNKYDNNNNGCDALDLPLSNLKFNITNGAITGSLISNEAGNYSIPLQAGTHTITPVIENPTYFIVYPANVIVDFPTQVSPFTQNFCVSANGVDPDLEVTLLPINAAMPGIDAKYKIIYKNKGNTMQSGTVNLVFNDSVLDLVVSNPVATSQSLNDLSWNFTNLLPFEMREIAITLNVNSPMETPAVNGGDALNYTATITSPATDDLPNDNTFAYNQTVVNSFDPNDKTCLEGATITPTKVGDYVHYMIRFENNGTANAQNIVVKDMIDTAKFDINSLIPIKGSHSFVTNITSGNKVEFIFQNINLPFDNVNNDGYVAFKIKTESTLVLGDTFSNNASIYFDYNFPIVTNTATTTIATLSVQDFVFSNYFSIYPNPVSEVLTVVAKESIEVTSINIYNTLGQLVLVIPNAQNTKTVDVSSLTTGNYFIKINSNKGTSNTKFIKN